MKLRFLLVTLLAAASAFAQDKPWPMPPPLAPVLAGVNNAAYAVPRMEWIGNVQTNVEKAHAPGTKVDLIFDGDSITAGWQSTGRSIWNEHYGKLNAFDFGIAGDGTQHLLWRLIEGKQADGLHPKLIVLMIGTNNLSNTADQVADAIKRIVAEYQKRCPEAVILLQAILPRGEQPANNPHRDKNKVINQTLAKFADGKKVIFIDFGDKFLNPDGTIIADLMPGFLHPSAKGYQIWADAIPPIINQYFPAASTAKP